MQDSLPMSNEAVTSPIKDKIVRKKTSNRISIRGLKYTLIKLR